MCPDESKIESARANEVLEAGNIEARVMRLQAHIKEVQALAVSAYRAGRP